MDIMYEKVKQLTSNKGNGYIAGDTAIHRFTNRCIYRCPVFIMDVDIVVVGSCCIDFISYVDQFPKPGETKHGHKFMSAFGGKGANQSVMAARLGAKVAMVAKVGEDSFGKDTVNNFAANNVMTDFIERAEQTTTGVVTITVDNEGQNSFISVRGANGCLVPVDVERAFKEVTSARIVLIEMEIDAETTLAALRIAKSHGYTTILNPSPAISNLREEFYGLADIICLNQTEAELLTTLSVSDIDGAKEAALVLLDRGSKNVILTLGKDGTVLVTSQDRTPKHIHVAPMKAVDTTGAGDCFLGSLAFYLARFPELPLEETVHRSNRIAAKSVQSNGTQPSYPWKKDLPAELFS